MTFRPDRRSLNPVWPIRWAALLVEKTTLNTIGVPFKCQWPIFQMRQQGRRDANVIIDDLPFGEASLWIKNFVQIRNGHGFSVDLERRFSFGRRLGSRRLRARTSGNRLPIRCPWFHLKNIGVNLSTNIAQLDIFRSNFLGDASTLSLTPRFSGARSRQFRCNCFNSLL
jgi:hypothetical protein